MRNRRGRSEGSIFEHARGWCAVASLGYDLNGKRRRRYVYGKTKQEVQAKLVKLQGAIAIGAIAEPARITLTALLERWLEDDVRQTLRPSTYISYKGLVDNHIVPFVGNLLLAKVTPTAIQTFYRELDAQGRSGRTRELVHAVLHRAFGRAVAWQLMTANPCTGVVKPKWKAKRKPKFFTAEQAVQFLEVAKADRLFALYVLALATGLRQGELLGLSYDDINFEHGLLTVRRTLVELRGELSFGEPKTDTGRRVVNLPQVALAALTEHQARMLAEGFDGPLVFVDTQGGPIRKSNLRRRSFDAILKAADLPHMRFHDLRHSCASLAMSHGVQAKMVQEMLGHSKVSFTLNIYSHLLPTIHAEAAQKMDLALTPVKTAQLAEEDNAA